MTTSKAQDPGSLLRGVIDARAEGNIEVSGYLDALNVLEKHFWVYEQRLQVISAPASFPEGEVMLQAGREGLERFQAALGTLKQIDPREGTEPALEALGEAEAGIELLFQLQSVSEEKEREFAEALQEMEAEEEH